MADMELPRLRTEKVWNRSVSVLQVTFAAIPVLALLVTPIYNQAVAMQLVQQSQNRLIERDKGWDTLVIERTKQLDAIGRDSAKSGARLDSIEQILKEMREDLRELNHRK